MIRINYVNPILNIGLSGWREAWLLSGEYPEKLYTERCRTDSFFVCVEVTGVSVI